MERYSSLELAHLVLGRAQHRKSSGDGRRLAAGWPSVGSASSAASTSPRRPPDGDAELAQHARDDGVVLIEQDGEQMLRLHLGVASVGREVDGRPEGLLGLDGESVCLHQFLVVRKKE